jgi:nucleoid-associated protein YejK|tara:strand:+ start:293 stop:517 length:225 start_codon:yes stop_codon:yes gene_type:complete
MENGDKSKDFLRFQVNRKVTNLYKNFLFMVEDLYNNREIDEETFQRIRKRILDYGNDTIREIEENLDNFEFKLK